MKNTLVRCFVLVLAVAGFTATSFSSPTAKTTAPTASSSIVGTPTPLCLPNDKSYCGMD
jgi:hypothetical protein